MGYARLHCDDTKKEKKKVSKLDHSATLLDEGSSPPSAGPDSRLTPITGTKNPCTVDMLGSTVSDARVDDILPCNSGVRERLRDLL